MTYQIYHPLDNLYSGTNLNVFIKKDIPFKQVAQVEANSIAQAFTYSQNKFNKRYSKLKIRDTYIGDVICQKNKKAFFIVTRKDFVLIDKINAYN